jgi:hypothetical protein
MGVRPTLLRQLLAGRDDAWILENKATLSEGITAAAETLRARQAILLA